MAQLKSLLESIQDLSENKPLEYRIYLAAGKPMALEKVFGSVQQAAKISPNSTLLIRLDQCVTESKAGFHAHFMKLVAQEISRKELAHKDISKIVKTYLNPFEIVEETKQIGISHYVQIGKQQKLTKRTV